MQRTVSAGGLVCAALASGAQEQNDKANEANLVLARQHRSGDYRGGRTLHLAATLQRSRNGVRIALAFSGKRPDG